jgi:uncharacterized protein (TIGR03000 family)
VESSAKGGDSSSKGSGDGSSKGTGGDSSSKGSDGDKKSTSAKLDDVMKTLKGISASNKAMEKRLKALEKKAGIKSQQDENEEDQQDENEQGAAVQRHVAILVVRVPVDARVFLDGQRTRTANQEVRTFVTPKLDDGSRYIYNVRAEITRDGQVRSESRRVAFYAGNRVNVSFPALEKDRTTVAARSR